MDSQHIVLIVLIGVVSCSFDEISGPVSEVTVRPGDNVVLHCDCKLSTGVYIVWYRNCSHENQPRLVLKGIPVFFHRFQFLRNQSSESYDLLIVNITDSDEGLYYCGTEKLKLKDEKFITPTYIYSYGKAITLIINSNTSSTNRPVVSWMILVFTPTLTILSSFLSFILIYHFCQETEPQLHQKRPANRGQNQDEELCLTQVVFLARDGKTD